MIKWFFLIVLLANMGYLGWEIDRDARLNRANLSSAIKVPAGTPRLLMLSELKKLPETRSRIKLDTELSVDNFNSEPVLPIDLNPNTEKMMNTLLTDDSLMRTDNGREEAIRSVNSVPSRLPSVNAEEILCYTYGPIPNLEESSLLSNWFNEREILYNQRQTNEQGKQLFWVYLAPRDSREQAVAAIKDLKQKGVKDVLLVREGDLLNAISLGLFSSQATVNHRLNEIKTKGYRPIVVPYSGGKKIHWFDVSVFREAEYVTELFTGFPARFNALPVDCNEIAMQ